MRVAYKKYQQRLHNGTRVLNSVPVGSFFIPYMYLTALLGCWKNLETFGSWRIGDITASVWLTVMLGTGTTGFAIMLLVRMLLDLF